MKVSFVALAPIVAAFFATSAFAAPYPGGRTASNDLSARDIPVDVAIAVVARALEEGEIDARGLGSLVNVVKKFRKATPEEKERRKAFVAGHKEYVKTGKEIAAQAKKESGGGANYNVKTQYHGPGYAEHGAKAEKLVKAGWHAHKNLQQYKHADISVQQLAGGRKMATARFHNGPGTQMSGVNVHHMWD
ncbi:hypothetical protein GALMADRAFT_214406 [Galerina marginata CBS 339.88]|uniref:SCP domain-containing protein n=1 Tax=Galerina marginata (strain CBS 339.88) TaxID=685588 RepID=A0A067SV61_GALM3|nr:hypothetical protein GALMADRAFT_214406 [Galerina marginata CBS 339.88]